MSVWSLEQTDLERQAQQKLYLEFLREPAISAGLYVLEAGAFDPQGPHTEDEIYVILEGRGQIRIGEHDFEVKPGDSVYVPANVHHRFHSILERLRVIVVFAPAEYTNKP